MQHLEPSPQILVVDDDPRLCSFLARFLTREGYSTTVVHDGLMMSRAVANGTFALVLLDMSFPGTDDGLALARGLRAMRSIPLIFLTGRSATADKVTGFEIGADDYITKPFEPQELLARIRAVLRRATHETITDQNSSSVLIFGGWRLDLTAREFLAPDGAPVTLTSQEFSLLAALASSPGRVLSREQLVNLVANRRWNPYDRSIDVLVSKVRQKMGDSATGGTWLKTVRSRGYVLVPSC